jgi:primosomal protein N'
VVETASERSGNLKDIAGVSGVAAVFNAELLESLVWASKHYVAPLSVILAKSTPPNLPKNSPGRVEDLIETSGRKHPLADVSAAVVDGGRRPTHALVGRWQDLDWLDLLVPVVAVGQSVMIVTATATEVDHIAETGRDLFGGRLVAVSGDSDSEITSEWEQVQGGGRIVVGTPRVANWMVRALRLVVVLEEGRRAMKDRQTPTLHVREMIRTRSLIEGFTAVFYGPTPSVEILSAGAEVVRVGNRAWPLVEVVDRSEEAPGSGNIAGSVVAAFRAMLDVGERSFVLTTHRKTEQLISEINARLGSPAAAVLSEQPPVVVGTERDFAGIDPVALVVASNVDGMLMGSGYRTAEETLRQLARLGNLLKRGPGHRMMIQTFDPNSELVATLRRGDPMPYLERILVDRARTGVPPSTEMLAVEVRGEQPPSIDSDLAALSGASVMGPLDIEGGRRWLLDGDLRTARVELRELVGRWRGPDTAVRVDADPIDL